MMATDYINELKKAFPQLKTAVPRNRDGKAYLSVTLPYSNGGYSTCSAVGMWLTCSTVGMWLRDNVDKDAYMTSGGGSSATYRLPAFTVVKTPTEDDTIEVVRDRYGKIIQVGSRVAFNHCGDVAIGVVETIVANPMPGWAKRNYGSREAWAKRTNRSLTFHVRHVNPDLDGYTISKVVNKGGIVVI